jgi:DNA (cytosine-5)-methyltransferase 1
MSHQQTDKPPYRIPTMDEVRALTPNGLKVISTFSGGGGSSLGYRMAGCTVIGASEFVPAAYEVYRANASPSTVVWTDDIREMSGLDMLSEVGLSVGELDILDGSPPCAAFSTAGKRSEGWGEVRKYSDTSQRVDDLFYEFARVLKQMQPRVFVAENVEGLVKGVAKGYFKAIHKALGECGYNVKAAVLDASWLGVPQRRKRLIFIGVRNDLGFKPEFPAPLPWRYSIRDALPYIDGQVKPGNSKDGWASEPAWNSSLNPSATIGASENTGNGRFPASVVGDDKTLIDLVSKRWAGEVPPLPIDNVCPTITATGMRGVNYSEVGWSASSVFHKIFGTSEIAIINLTDQSPTIMADGFAAVSRHQCGIVGLDQNGALLDPETGEDLTKVSQTLRDQYPDKFLRKLAISEVRQLCSYPQDFILKGSYAQRWERMGRSVPPLMMKAIAQKVSEMLCAD